MKKSAVLWCAKTLISHESLLAVKGGPLEDQFRLCQFHFHWGENNAWGSEHSIDRRLFPAEVFLVLV